MTKTEPFLLLYENVYFTIQVSSLLEARWCSGQTWRPLEPLTRVRISPGLPFHMLENIPIFLVRKGFPAQLPKNCAFELRRYREENSGLFPYSVQNARKSVPFFATDQLVGHLCTEHLTRVTSLLCI
jgi:hypothetical protein